MNLQQIQIGRAQALETGVDGIENGSAAQTALVDVVLTPLDLFGVLDVHDAGLLADGAETFGQQNQFVPGDLVLLNRLADHLLGNAVRVHVRRVPGVQAAVVRALEEFVHFGGVVNHPGLPIFVACRALHVNVNDVTLS